MTKEEFVSRFMADIEAKKKDIQAKKKKADIEYAMYHKESVANTKAIMSRLKKAKPKYY